MSQIQRIFKDSDLRGTRTLLLGLISLWALGQLSETAASYLGFIPAYTVSVQHYYIWNIFTAGFFETSFFMGVVNILVVVVVCPLLEHSWGFKTFLRFLVIVNLSVFVTLFAMVIVVFAATQDDHYLFRRVCGFSAINAAFAVALKQRYAETPVVNVPGVNMLKFKHLPMFICFSAILLWWFGSIGGKETPLVLFGTLYGWIYLRFYMVDLDTQVVGDLRDDFSFSSLFPDVPHIRAVITVLSVICFRSLRGIGFFADAVKSQPVLPMTTDEDAFFRSTGPIDPTAERRRALAIKAIDDKLAELSKQPNLLPLSSLNPVLPPTSAPSVTAPS